MPICETSSVDFDIQFDVDAQSDDDTQSESSDLPDEQSDEDVYDSSDSEDEDEDDNTRMDVDDDTHLRVKRVLAAIAEQGFTLATFLNAFSWGSAKCIQDDEIKNSRTAFMNSKELPRIIHRWWKPPRSGKSNRSRAQGAKKVMESFAKGCMADIREKEMAALQVALTVPAKSFNESTLTNISLRKVVADMEERSPTLWTFLYGAGSSKKQKARGTKKRPDKIVMMVISMLSYARNQTCNALQKLFSMYFKYNKISERAFDCLHGLGIVMSSSWMSLSIEQAAEHAMSTLIREKDLLAMVLAHDNVNIPFQVFSQRLNNKSHFDSGTAATAFLQPYIPPLPPAVAHTLRSQRRNHSQLTITHDVIINHELVFSEQLVPHLVHRILYFLLRTPAFDIGTYKFKDSTKLHPPNPLRKLPFGREWRSRQFLLHTRHMEEASYEGNDQLLIEWLKQLRMNTHDELQRTALDRIIAFVGDQLTSSRVRGLYKIKAENINSLDRLDNIVPVFGWLHLLMAFANSLHKQYIGTKSSHGLLAHAFALLDKKGLTQTSTKGPFYHDLCEALEHILEAHIRVCVARMAGVENIAELRERSPDELQSLASTVYQRYVARSSLDDLDDLPKTEQDQDYRNTCLIVRDLLHFSVLKNVGVKEGDVGIMEAMLPYLFARFVGSGSSNYTTEVLELMQGLWSEWPPELAEFVRTSCWLVNFAGKRDSFLPIDMAQEHNIRDIKVTYRPDGPSSGWEYLRKVSPAIPAIRSTSEHVNAEMKTLSRGKKHTSPSKENDVGCLVKDYKEAKIHLFRAKTTLREKVSIRDFVAEGWETLQKNRTMLGWKEKRDHYRSDLQIWPETKST